VCSVLLQVLDKRHGAQVGRPRGKIDDYRFENHKRRPDEIGVRNEEIMKHPERDTKRRVRYEDICAGNCTKDERNVEGDGDEQDHGVEEVARRDGCDGAV